MKVDKNGYSSNEDCLNKNLYIIKTGVEFALEEAKDKDNIEGLKRASGAIDSIQEYFKIGKYMSIEEIKERMDE